MDLMFFLLESPQSPKHVAAVQVFKKPKNAPDTYLRDLVAAFKAAPVVAPFNYYPHFPRMGMPEWRVQEDMDMDYHVRHSAVPGPGSDEQLMEVIQRLHAGMLDRRRPGWICQVIEGLENDRFAVYSKIHHAYIDGMTGVKRMYGALSTSSRTRKIVPPWSYELERPSSAGKRRDSDPLKPILKRLRGLGEVTGLLSDMGLQWLNVREGKAQIPYSATPTLLNKPLEWETRSTAVCTLPLDRVKAIGKERGCTVNEVVLAIIDAALHDYLQRLGESTGDPLIALCPMIAVTDRYDIASIGGIDEFSARPLFILAEEVGQEIVAVQMHFVGLAANSFALLQFRDDVVIARRRHKGRHPVHHGDDFVRNLARRDPGWPAHHHRHPVAAFPTAVLFASVWGVAAVRPQGQFGAVIGGIHNDGVVGDTQLVQLVEQLADMTVMLHQSVGVKALSRHAL
jgi:hypothetical protein